MDVEAALLVRHQRELLVLLQGPALVGDNLHVLEDGQLDPALFVLGLDRNEGAGDPGAGLELEDDLLVEAVPQLVGVVKEFPLHPQILVVIPANHAREAGRMFLKVADSRAASHRCPDLISF